MKLIILEGQEACGKSTACEPLVRKLGMKGVRAAWRREPGGTTIGEDMRKFLLSHKSAEPASLFYGFQIARVELIADMLRTHDIDVFVLDRFWPSTWAYQVHGEGIPREVFRASQQVIQPYLARFEGVHLFYLECPDDIRLERMKKSGKGADRFESKPKEYHDRIRAGYNELVCAGDLIPVDASASQEAVLGVIMHRLGY